MGLNQKFIRKVQAKRRAAELKAKHVDAGRTIDDPQRVVRAPQPTPQPGYNSQGTFDPELQRIDLAQRWLGGYEVESTTGLLVRVYPEGAEECEGRKALAQLLWDGNCPPDLMRLLGMYMAPDGDGLADSDFRLKLEKRRSGAMRNSAAVLQVGLMIMDEVDAGKCVEESIALAAAYFNLQTRQVKTYWSRFKRQHKSGFEALRTARADD